MDGIKPPRGSPAEVSQHERRGRTSCTPLGPGEDRDSFSVAFRLWALLVSDVTTQSLGSGDTKAAFVRLEDLTPHELLSALDSLSSAHLAMVSGKAQPAFLRAVLGTVPSQVRGFVTTLERGIGRITMLDPVAVFSWRQVLTFLLRSNYGLLEEGGFAQEWVQRNESMNDRDDFPWLTEDFSRYTDVSFESDVREFMFPHHGPGAVAYRGSDGELRTARLSINRKDALLRNSPYFDQRFCGHLPGVVGDTSVPSVLMEVPKTWKKNRLIAVESADRMFLQQAFKEGLYAAVRRDTFWSRHICFQHAEMSHPFVRRGSLDSSFATIDLSAASDSVKQTHVLRLFDAHPFIRDGLFSARAQFVQVAGKILPIRMFASMGNATTFPVETLLFGTCCVEAIRRSGDSPQNSRFRVYGDDILIECKYASCLQVVLNELGFHVNREKSFDEHGTHFRESCGVEFYNGYDVTPLRLPRDFASVNFSHATIYSLASWVDVCNASWRLGFRKLAGEIRRVMLSEARRAIPLSEDGRLGFQVDRASNSHLPSLFSPDFQRYTHVYPGYCAITEPRRDMSLGLYEFLGRAHGSCWDTARTTPAAWQSLLRSGLLEPPPAATITSRVGTGNLKEEILFF